MTERDSDRFRLLMVGLAEVFGGDVSEAKLTIYYAALEDLTLETVERAVKLLVKSRTTASFPKPAELRQAVEGTGDERAMLALSAVDPYVRQRETYQTLVFDDPVIHAVVERMGGIDEMGLDWPYKHKEFLTLYRALTHTPPAMLPDRIIGSHEADNRKAFPKFLQAPVRIAVGAGRQVVPQLTEGA